MNSGSPAPTDPVRRVHVIVPEPEGSVGGADMHVCDLAAAQLRRRATSPVVFETLSPSFAARVRAVGVECRSVAGRGWQAVLPALRRLLVKRRIEVVHSHGYNATWWAVAALASMRRRPRLVVTCHGWIETTPTLRMLSALDRAANRCAAGIVAVSDELVAPALANASGASAFALVPNGIPVRPLRAAPDARAHWGLPPDRPLVGAIGRLALEKRHDVFIMACRTIAAHRPDVDFVLAGGGPLRAALARQVAAVGLTERVHLVGVVDDPEALLAELAVVVQPSDTETTSRVLLEAMMQARPVVATNVGGTATLLRHGRDGILVPPGNPAAIAAEVLALMAAPERAAWLGRSARARAISRFNADDMAAAVDDVYSAVLGRGAQRHDTWMR